jgi:hypothetical protein
VLVPEYAIITLVTVAPPPHGDTSQEPDTLTLFRLWPEAVLFGVTDVIVGGPMVKDHEWK